METREDACFARSWLLLFSFINEREREYNISITLYTITVYNMYICKRRTSPSVVTIIYFPRSLTNKQADIKLPIIPYNFQFSSRSQKAHELQRKSKKSCINIK